MSVAKVFGLLRSQLRRRRVALAVTLMASVVIAASDPTTTVRQEFMQAHAAVKAGSLVASDSAALQAYMLYPYLQAARLQLALTQTTRDTATLDQSIKDFLSAQGAAPLVRNLRRAWLLDLATRREWTLFLANLPANAGDAELRCLAATAQLSNATGDASGTPATTQDATLIAALSGSLTSLWLSANRLPAACNAPFEWARSNRIISADLIEQRVRLTLKAGNAVLARELAAMLPAEQARPLLQWATLIEKPQQAIDAVIARPGIGVEPVALQDGWLRLARKDQDAAEVRLPRLIRALKMNEAAASPYVLSLALTLSWSRHDGALRYFKRVAPGDMSDTAHEWQVRAALWAGDWLRVRQSIAAMPEALRAQARWRYWQARAAEQLQDPGAARALYQALIDKDDNYYAAMAAARLGSGYTPHPQPLPTDTVTVQALAKLPGMLRVRELLAVQLRNEAESEWTQVFATLQPGEHLAAAQLAHEWAWHDQAVATTAKLGLYNDYEFLYPQPYDPEVSEAAKLSGLSEDLIYGVMRQETLFRPDAQSVANARGLLQLLPETARATARKHGMPVPTADELFNPATNVPLGAVYLKSLVDSFDGQVVLALASYNAGPAAARRWLPARAMESDVWIENIPYNETRAYVQRVLWHSLVFHWLRTDKSLDTQAWLAKVQP